MRKWFQKKFRDHNENIMFNEISKQKSHSENFIFSGSRNLIRDFADFIVWTTNNIYC